MINISLQIRKLPPATGRGGGVFWSELWSTQIWSFPFGGGVFWSELWSTQIWSFPFSGGGYSGVNFGQLKSEVFHFQVGGILEWTLVNSNLKFSKFQNRGVLEYLDTNFIVWGYCTQTCLCITDSLSHTTYVETKKCWYELRRTICNRYLHNITPCFQIW